MSAGWLEVRSADMLGLHLLQQMELKVGYSVKRRDASTRTTRFPTDVRGGEFNFCNHLCVANRELFCSVSGAF